MLAWAGRVVAGFAHRRAACVRVRWSAGGTTL